MAVMFITNIKNEQRSPLPTTALFRNIQNFKVGWKSEISKMTDISERYESLIYYSRVPLPQINTFWIWSCGQTEGRLLVDDGDQFSLFMSATAVELEHWIWTNNTLKKDSNE